MDSAEGKTLIFIGDEKSVIASLTVVDKIRDNAKDVISQLEIKYNRARQAAITLELTDIIGGANAANGGN